MRNPSAVLHGPNDLRIEDRPIPAPGTGEVLAEITVVGICGSDVHYFEHGRIGDYVVRQPMIIGHESAGTVVDVGDGIDPERLGQLVALEPGVPCRRCGHCVIGRYNLCPDVRFFATPPIDGSITRYVAIRADFAHPVPAGLTAEQAAMAEPVSVGIWAARKTAITAGDRVLVTGGGPIGLLAAQVARAFGAQVPVVTDLSSFRLDRASQLGLRAVSASTPLHEEFDVLLECSGAAPALASREVSVTGVFRYAHTYPLALRLISDGSVDVQRVITHRFALDQTSAALTIARTDPQALKAIVACRLGTDGTDTGHVGSSDA